MTVRVVTDSVASIPEHEVQEEGIEVVSLYVHDGETNRRELDMDVASFYERIRDMRILPTSSQPSVESFVEAFRRGLEHGAEVLGVLVSHKMSGTMESARIAADMVLAEKPGSRIELLDTGSNSMMEGFGVLAAARAANAGESIERCKELARETLDRTRFLFAPESLEYLRRGGRIGAASALIGGLLQIKPILTVENGETSEFAKVRSRRRALDTIVKQFSDDIATYGLRQVIVHYIGDSDPAERFARERIEPLVGGPVRVLPVSPVVGLHVGPVVAIIYETERAWRRVGTATGAGGTA
jgi:DegV family protein with EDD domain